MTEEEERACVNPVLCDLIFHQHRSSPKKSANDFVHPNLLCSNLCCWMLNGINIGTQNDTNHIGIGISAVSGVNSMYQMCIASFLTSNNMIIKCPKVPVVYIVYRIMLSVCSGEMTRGDRKRRSRSTHSQPPGLTRHWQEFLPLIGFALSHFSKSLGEKETEI